MKQTLFTAFKITVTLGLLAWLLSTIDLGRLADTLAGASPVGLCVLIGIYFGNKCIAAYRWHWLLRCNGSHPPFGDVLRWSLVGGAVSAALPFGAAGTEVARVAAAARDRWKVSLLAIAAMVDRMIGVTTLALVVLIGSRFSAVPLPGAGLVALALLAATALGALAAARRWDVIFAAVLPARLRRLIVKPLDMTHAAILAYSSRPGALAYAFAVTLGFQCAKVAGAYAGCLTLGIDVSFAFLLAAFPLVLFANMLPISLNGIGVREVGLTYALGFAGVPVEQAAALGLTLSAMNIVANLPGTVLLFRPTPRDREDQPGDQPGSEPQPKPGTNGHSPGSQRPRGSPEGLTTRTPVSRCEPVQGVHGNGGPGHSVTPRTGAGGR